MKCIQHRASGTITRLSDSTAVTLTAGPHYIYCNKTEWKKQRTKQGRRFSPLNKREALQSQQAIKGGNYS